MDRTVANGGKEEPIGQNPMDRKPFFSIIIPVYNVAPYLRECLDSVLAQKFGDWEAICVDDGSTDGSGAILDEYAVKDKRFKMFHQPNSGVSAARNRGLDEVMGVWLLFLDSDDVYKYDVLSVCRSVICKYPAAELIRFNYKEFDEKNICAWEKPSEIYEPKEISFEHELTAESYSGSLWGGAYKFESIRNVRFRPFCLGEDRVWLAEVIDIISRGVRINLIEYGYRQRPTSAVRQKMDEARFNDEVWWRVALLHIWENSAKSVSPVILHQHATIFTERLAYAFFAMSKEARRKVFYNWLLAMREYSKFKSVPIYFKILTRINSIIRLQIFTWATCWIPHRLKLCGIHR